MDALINFTLKLVLYPLFFITLISLPIAVILAIIEGLYSLFLT